jgi:prepilin-type processing-associated H-X9-DG protein/prepilin-type N-terminal cleavage/methylation domain-containing protein
MLGAFMKSHVLDSRKGMKGMTLLEILVVISIIAVLVGLLFPSIKGIQQMGKTVQCMNNLRQIGAALQLYSADYQGKFPSIGSANLSGISGGWSDRLTAGYLSRTTRISTREGYVLGDIRETKVWWCPEAKFLPISQSSYRLHYGINPWAFSSKWDIERQSLMRVPQPTKTILLAEYNWNSSAMDCDEPPTYRGDLPSRHRFSHRGGKGANYLFVDGHVEYIKGLQGTGSSPAYRDSETNKKKMWKWW